MVYQQGDVILEKVEGIRGRKLNHLVLAKGEVTGHCHKVTEGIAELYKDGAGKMFLRVTSDTVTITHEEHNPVKIPMGDWSIRAVREYDHFLEESRNVSD